MSGIVLSASVRQNLLALQSTASLLAKTQNDLATGNKVNSALDNPTEYFTAQSLNNRAGDISNLLDGISNGVQVLQAANTGLTSLQQLVDNAKSIANQVLQTTTGYDTKSNVTSAALTNATATNLLGAATTPVIGNAVSNNNSTTPVAITGTTLLSGASNSTSNDLSSALTTADTLVVNGTTFTFAATSSSSGTSIGIGDNVTDLLAAIDAASNGGSSSIANGAITLTPSPAGLTLSGSALAKLGLSAQPPGGGLVNDTLTIQPTGGGTTTNLTFGFGNGQISTLNQLNAALAANNLQASISPAGAITLQTTNNAASSTIAAITGTSPFTGLTGGAPVADPNSQATRANLVSQYNNLLAQINTTAQDSSFNGINLLNGDTLNLVFNETGRSTLNIQGVIFNAGGIGLSQLTQGTDFLDSNSANKVLSALNFASDTLRSEASALGSNLSIVQIRQDFNKNLVNVLQTGASNLVLADPNEEAANSQALSTRQSIAVSALALANQSQASVLQLLR
jgi:flagellin-like hook-associated protein FlgL